MPSKKKGRTSHSHNLSVNDSANGLNSKNGDEFIEYAVEKILAVRTVGGDKQYLVKWENYDDTWNQWIPESDLNCNDLLNEFQTSKRPPDESLYVDKKEKTITKLKVKRKSSNVEEDTFAKEYKRIMAIHFMEWSIESIKSTSGEKIIKLKRILSSNGDSSIPLIKVSEQMRFLKEWEDLANQKCTEAKIKFIRLENKVDVCLPPNFFTYITQNILSSSVVVNSEAIIGCNCSPICSSTSKCCPVEMEARFAYNTKGRLLPGFFGKPIFECNRSCLCDTSCHNRVVQHGRQIELCIFRTSNGRGWGVKTLEPIKRGSFVLEYLGEVITNDEVDERYGERDPEYVFDLDFHDYTPDFVIDATRFGNESHFVNHSCDPNLNVYAVYIDNLDVRMPRLALFANRDINIFEELTFDYCLPSSGWSGREHSNSLANQPKSELSREEPRHQSVSMKKENGNDDEISHSSRCIECLCGSISCRGYVFLRKIQ